MALNILIVDDEILARNRIKNLLINMDMPLRIDECANGKLALNFLKSSSVDLLFLDVQMPELSGFELLEHLPKDALPVTIFVTAYDKYALRAFDAHAIDYLLKPFDDERFYEAFDRAQQQIELIENKSSFRQKLINMIDELTHKGNGNKTTLPDSEGSLFSEKLVLKESGKIHFVKTKDISHIKADGKYIQVFTDGKNFKIRQTLVEMESKLSSKHFLRIHRSSILNIDLIQEMQHWYKGEYVFIMQDGERLISGNSYRKNIEGILKQIC